MRKRLIDPIRRDISIPDAEWLDLERLAEVEITSEETGYPIESALLPGSQAGWRAAHSGAQLVRLSFDRPQQIRRIWLTVTENERERTQEFVLRWSRDGKNYKEIVRQQWNFSPSSSSREVEDFKVDLPEVSVLELEIVPDISGGDARASLKCMRLA
jgi:hypothetical protein